MQNKSVRRQDVLVRNRRRLTILIVSLAVVVVVVYFYSTDLAKKQRLLQDLYGVLQQQGYQPNIGLSSAITPGTVVQTIELDKDGQQKTITPALVVLWGKDCFPDRRPISSNFALPDTSSNLSSSLQLDAPSIDRFLVGLTIDNNLVINQKLKMDNVHVLTFAKGDLSQQFSQKCVDALSRSISEGDRVDWFSVVNETIVADGLYYEIHWQDSTTAKIRHQKLEQIQSKLAQVLTSSHTSQDNAEGVKVVSTSESSSVISVTGSVVLAYRIRPLQPVYGDE